MMAKSYLFRVALIIFAAALSGCVIEPIKNYDFDPQGQDGFVIFDVTSHVGGYMLSFDELTDVGRLRREWTGRDFNNYQMLGVGKKHYVADRFGPGTYVLARYYFKQTPSRENIVMLRNGTIKFTVKPGKIIYLGDIELSDEGCKFSDGSLTEAKKYLSKYPKVKGDVEYIRPSFTEYRD